VDRLAEQLDVRVGVAWTLLVLFSALLVGTAVRLASLGKEDSGRRRSRIASLRTWWILSVLFAAALLAGRGGVALLFGLASLLGLREYLALTFEMRRDRVADFLAYVAVPLQYLWIYLGYDTLIWTFLPVLFFLLLSARLVLTGTTTGFVYDVGSVFWGVMLIVFCLSHAFRLAVLPEKTNPAGGWPGWVLYLVVLTELNDIAQALWGRQLGKHKVTPSISPHKTWEGLLFGMATTVVAAAALAPWLTPLGNLPSALPLQWGMLAGLIIAIGGFLGDINMSAVKRDMGVKDSSSLLPGQGGMLDRIDSLSFSAPLFYYYVVWLYRA
jgi:phosphatidate cytidylyltransferase